MPFTATTIGANAHTCELDGRIAGRMASLEDGACLATFATTGKTVVVATNGAPQYQDNCGARARFEGTYTRLSAACTSDAVRASRKRFRQPYAAKSYGTARTTLSAVRTECENMLDRLTVGRIRNDLAIAQFNSGDKAGCLATLRPLASDAAMTDTEIRENYAPADARDQLPIVRATRFNLARCRS